VEKRNREGLISRQFQESVEAICFNAFLFFPGRRVRSTRDFSLHAG